jgi:hypothetical protein
VKINQPIEMKKLKTKILSRLYSTEALKLFFKKNNSKKEIKYPPLIILHGLFGNYRNFGTFSNQINENSKFINIFLIN